MKLYNVYVPYDIYTDDSTAMAGQFQVFLIFFVGSMLQNECVYLGVILIGINLLVAF